MNIDSSVGIDGGGGYCSRTGHGGGCYSNSSCSYCCYSCGSGEVGDKIACISRCDRVFYVVYLDCYVEVAGYGVGLGEEGIDGCSR